MKKYEKRLKKLQRKLSKKQHPTKRGDKTPLSNNYKKQKEKTARFWLKISNARNDYLHELTTAIVKNNGIAAVENLKVKNMSRSAKGTLNNPGHNVRAKSSLNRNILKQSWGIFFSLLEYKLLMSGGTLIKVNPQYTSQTCPMCKHTSKNNRKSQAVFVCEKCGYSNNADLIAAVNILRAALGNEYPKYVPQDLREVTPVEYAKYTVKQEPAENREEVPLLEAV